MQLISLDFFERTPYNLIMSLTTSIPNWNANGILPPIAPGASSTSRDRSPYNVNLSEFINRFSYSDERIDILDGFLRFREDLRLKGFVVGFQWLNGSFIENIEETEGRPPHDLDVVTFYSLSDSENQSSRFDPNFFVSRYLKEKYKVDGYFVQANHPDYKANALQMTYWYSMWSHRRNGLWKGFLQIDLDFTNDNESQNILDIKKEGMQ